MGAESARLMGGEENDSIYTEDESNRQSYDEPHVRGRDTAKAIRLHKQLRLLMLLAILLHGAVIITLFTRPSSESCQAATGKTVAVANGDFQSSHNHIVPEFPLIVTVFEDMRENKKTVPVNDESRWMKDMPIGGGFINLTNHEGGDSGIVAVSAFHQHHCLYMIENMLARVIENPDFAAEIDSVHMFHCVEFLRQVVRCLADPTLDPTYIDPKRPNFIHTTGWSGSHVCRDWDALFKWTEEHRAGNYEGLGEGSPSHHGGHGNT